MRRGGRIGGRQVEARAGRAHDVAGFNRRIRGPAARTGGFVLPRPDRCRGRVEPWGCRIRCAALLISAFHALIGTLIRSIEPFTCAQPADGVSERTACRSECDSPCREVHDFALSFAAPNLRKHSFRCKASWVLRHALPGGADKLPRRACSDRLQRV